MISYLHLIIGSIVKSSLVIPIAYARGSGTSLTCSDLLSFR